MLIPDEFRELFVSDVFFGLATVAPNGVPHLTPIWIDYDGTHLLINTQRGRRKTKNVQRDPNVAVMGWDPDDPYRYISVLGKVIEISEQGAVDHYNELALQYTGEEDRYERKHANKEQPRVILYIEPEKVITQNGA